MKRIIRVVLDHAQICYVFAWEALPCCRVCEHEVGVDDEECERDQVADDQYLKVEEEEQVTSEPLQRLFVVNYGFDLL